MKKTILFGIALTAGSIAVTVSHAKEPKNLEMIKESLVHYHDSGAYLKDQTKVVDKAMLYLKNRLEREQSSPSHKKLAIVLDIDETSLSNYPDMVKLGFGGTNEEINDAEGRGDDPAIKPTLALYQYAKQNHVAVFFVTGRTQNYLEGTAANLKNVGFKNWDGLVLKPMNYHEHSAANYKIAERNKIENKGYDIVLNMGDQESDLRGGHADKTFKLPNPYYVVP